MDVETEARTGSRTRLSGRLEALREWTLDNPSWALAGLAATAVLVSFVRTVVREGKEAIGVDPAFFLHVGWSATNGASPYVHAWDVKPPLTFELATLISFVSGGNPYIAYGLSVLVTGAALVAIVVLVGKLVARETGSRRAALLAGVAIVAFAPFHLDAATGLRAKHFTLAAGLAGLWLVREGRPIAAGALAAASPAFWHPGVVFPGLVLLEAHRAGTRRDVGGVLLGGGVAAGVVLVPIVAWGAFEAMMVETVLAPLSTGEGGDLLFRGAKGILHLGWMLPLVLVGAWGIVQGIGKDPRGLAWLAIGSAWVALQVGFLDYDGPADLYLGVTFVAVGLGLLYTRLNAPRRRALTAGVGGLLVVSLVAQGGFGVVFDPASYSGDEMREDPALVHRGLQTAKTYVRGGSQAEAANSPTAPDAESAYGASTITELFWERETPASCHYRLGEVEKRWLAVTDRPPTGQTCGDWPDGHWGISW